MTVHDSCDEALLARYVCGELADPQRRSVDTHLVSCACCWDEVRVSREAAAAVRRAWDPAPLGLRADVRAALQRFDPAAGHARRDVRRWPVVLAAAAVVVALLGVGARWAAPEPARSVASEAVAAVGAAPGGDRSGVLTAAPDLSAVGLAPRIASHVVLAGSPASRFTYGSPNGDTLDVYVGSAEWRRPAGAAPLGDAGWMAVEAGYTVVAGADPAGDDMLLVASDHAMAMAAAVGLHLV